MAQPDCKALIAKIRSLEAAAPGYCDFAIAKIKAQEGSFFTDFVLKHVGATDPKALEEKIISALQTVKSLATEEAKFVDPFLDMLLSLIPATGGA